MRRVSPITELQEYVLSYMVGLGPLGSEVYVYHKWLDEDMRGMGRDLFHQTLRRLVQAGAIEKVAQGTRGSPARFVVLKRPEAFNISSSAMVRVWTRHVVNAGKRVAAEMGAS